MEWFVAVRKLRSFAWGGVPWVMKMAGVEWLTVVRQKARSESGEVGYRTVMCGCRGSLRELT